MNPARLTRLLTAAALVLFLGTGALAAWTGSLVLNPVRLVTFRASGSSVLAEPKAFFQSASLSGSVGKAVSVPVMVDSNGGSLAAIATELRYNPLDVSVSLDTAAPTVCSQVTDQMHETVAGRFLVSCTAPTTTVQVAPFVTFSVTPRRGGVLVLQLIGRSNDYMVLRIE